MRRVSSMFWNTSEVREKRVLSALCGNTFFIAANLHIYGWVTSGQSAHLKFAVPINQILDEEGDELLDIGGNDKYFGLLSRYGTRMKIVSGPASDFGTSGFLPQSRAVPLPADPSARLVMPYLSEVACLSAGSLWLGGNTSDTAEKVDELVCVGAFDGKVQGSKSLVHKASMCCVILP